MNPKTAHARSTALRKEMNPSRERLSLRILSSSWSILRGASSEKEEELEEVLGGCCCGCCGAGCGGSSWLQ